MPDKLDLEFQIKIAETSLAKAKAQIASLQSDNKTLGKLQVGVDSSGIRTARSSLGQIRNDADQFTKSMAAANARVLAFGTAVGVIEGMRRSFLALIKTTVDVEYALAKIAVVAGEDLQKAGVSISALGKSLFQIAKDTGQTFDTVNQAALEFQRQGIGVQESLKRTRDAMIGVRISGLGVGEAVSGLTSILNAFNKSGLDSTKVLNKLVALDNASAASFTDLIQGMQRAASISQLAGNNFDQTAASIATLQEITARGGPQIGNALKSIDTRIYGDESLKFLSEFRGGIVKIKDESGQLLPSIEIIRNLSNALKDVPKQEELAIVNKLVGLYQVNSAEALIDSFKAVNGQITLYDKNLKTVANANKEANNANESLSKTLKSSFNVLDVQVGELLNKFGELGVKNPLGGILDFLIRIQNTMQGILQGSGPIDQLIQGLVSFSGSALFSAPVLAGGAFVLVKIIKDFLKFASTAFQVFTGINRKLTEQESVQGSISAKIKESATSLNSVISGEQKRLSLTKATTAEYSKQLALAGATSTSLKTKNNAQQFIFGEERVVKPKVGQLNSAAAKSLNTPRSGVGAFGFGGNQFQAQSLSKRATGERKTLIVGQAGLDEAIVSMSKKWLATGLEGEKLSAAIRQYVGTLNLSRDSFLEVSSATNKYANKLIKEREALSKNPPKPAFTQGARGLPAPSGLQGQIDPAVAKALSFQRSVNPPRIASDLFNASAGKTFAEKLARDERGRIYRAQNEERIANNEALKERLKQSRASGGMAGPSGRLVGGISEPIFGAPKAKSGFDQDVLRNFAFKAILLTSAVDGITSSFRGVSEETDRLADATSRASYAMAGILALNQVGGLNLGGLLSGGGGGLSKIFGGFGSKLSSLLTPILAFGKGILRIVPIVGQVALGLTILNEAVRGFTGESLYEKIFGGLSESAEKAKNRFNEIASQLFDPQGKFVGTNPASAKSNLDAIRLEAETEFRARKIGINTKGKSTPDILDEEIRKRIEESLTRVKTGRISAQKISSEGGGVAEFQIEETFSLLSQGIQEIIKDILKQSIPSPEKMREAVSSLGNKKFDNKTLDGDIIGELINSYNEAVLDSFVKAQKDRTGKLDFGKGAISLGAPQFKSSFADFVENFTTSASKTSEKGSSKAPSNAPVLSPEILKNVKKIQDEIRSLVIEGTISSLESQIKTLEFKASGLISENEKGDLLNAADNIRKKIFANQRQQSLTNIQSRAEDIRSSGKPPQEIESELKKLKVEYANQRAAIKANENAAKGETEERKRAADSLSKFNIATNAAQSALSTISVTRARSNQEVSRLESAANDPTANIFARESFQRQANQAKIKDLQTSGLAQIEAQKAETLARVKTLPEDQRKLETQKANDTANEQEIVLRTQIQELEAANKNIGAFSSASVELTNSLEEFRRSIAQSQAQNEINLLQATDSSGIAGGLISKQVFGAAEGKSGEELVSFLADQNFLLNEQFKIRTASSAAEKLELETQLELSRELLDIKTQSLDPAEKQRQIEEAINKNLEKRRSFGFGVSQAQSNIQSEIQTFGSDFGKTATEGFRDGLVSAMQVAASQTDNLKDSLLDVALAFANKLRDAALTNLANIITNSFIPKKDGSGGVISSLVGAVGSYFTQPKGYASGGSVTGGSGVKDDVPTLLMGGEYVIPKSTVQEYGKGFFDSLRNGSVGKMAQGGYFAPGVRGQGTISGKENLLDFATQTATSGKGDYISQLSGNAAIASLEPESLRLSNFNRFGDSPIVQATQDTKEQAFGLYLDQLNVEKEYQTQLLQAEERAAALKKAEKDKKKQFLISLALAAVGAGVSYGVGKVGTSTPKAISADLPHEYNSQTGLYETVKAYQTKPVGGNIFSSAIKGIAGAFKATAYGNADIDATTARDQELANSGNPAYKGFSQTIGASGRTLVPGYSVASNHYALGTKLRINGQLYSVDDRGGMSKNVIDFYSGSDRALYKKYANMGRINPQVYRNSGGYVGGNGDNVPAMLSNKEYVLNSSAAKKLGDKNLYALNSGQPQSGGDSSDKIISKLDELIQKTVGASNITVSVTMDSSGKEQSSQSSDEGSQQGDTQRNLSRKIKETVVNVIREEQRPGGILARR